MLKIAKVIALFKAGSTEELNNYRPISLPWYVEGSEVPPTKLGPPKHLGPPKYGVCQGPPT